MITLQKILCRFALLAAWFFFASSAFGQWTTQSINLQPGWNAVFLEVQPQPSDCGAVFAGLPVERVLGWNRKFSPVQYIQNASAIVAPQPDWLFYVPAGSGAINPSLDQQSLFSVEGGKCYLIKMPDTAAPTNWVVLGQPTLRKISWVPNSLNLVGFALDRTNPPTFAKFFSGSSAHANNPVYRLAANGLWVQAVSLSTSVMQSGEAFWIQCNGASDYQGPIGVSVPQRTGLTYGRTLVEQSINIQNLSGVSKDLVFTVLPSANPPTEDVPPLAGAVPLSYWKLDRINNPNGWMTINPTVTRTNLKAGQTWQMRFEVRRPDMTPSTGGNGAIYQSLLEIRDVAGSSRVVIPVSALGLNQNVNALQASGGRATKSTLQPPLHPGLWVGNASVGLVSQPAADDPNTPTNTASPFQFRLIMHVDAMGKVLFMQRVLQMWQMGTYKANPDDPSKLAVDQPGRYVLLTDEALIPTIPNLTGATLRDGQPVGRRFSTSAFGFRRPIPMTGNGQFGVGASVYNCQVVLDYDDPLNPFKHLYHPDHDNLDPRFEQKMAEGRESFTVIRDVKLQFTESDPVQAVLAGWGDSQIGGVYSETITGLHQKPLYIQGTFSLTRASTVTGLDGNP